MHINIQDQAVHTSPTKDTDIDTRVYLDNAAATAVDPRVLDAMEPFWRDTFGNAGALHKEGVAARHAIDTARHTVARVLYARTDEIVFTSGGTEANNLAIIGSVRAARQQGRSNNDIHLITSTIEHSSVVDCLRVLEKEGVAVTYIPVDTDGLVDLAVLKAAIRKETLLVSLIYAHNEIGTIQNMSSIAKVLRAARTNDSSHPLLHTDASQAPTWLPCHITSLGVDLLTLDAQKICGPKGVGCLYKSRHIELEPILHGGGQEYHLRPGTPPTPLIVGFAHALSIVEEERDNYVITVRATRDFALTQIQESVPWAIVNGPTDDRRIQSNINVSFPGLDAEQIVLEMDARGVAISTRSACLQGDIPGSYVVRALKKGDAAATSAVRLSLSRFTTRDEIAFAIDQLTEVVQRLKRQKTPHFDDAKDFD